MGWMNQTENEFAQENLQNQICLDNGDEPLKSYLDGKLDFFYSKLQIFRVNGDTYETQATLIERGGPQPAPAQSSAKQLPGEIHRLIYDFHIFKSCKRYSHNAFPAF